MPRPDRQEPQATTPPSHPDASPASRRLPHVTMPASRDRSLVGTVVSLAFHALLVFLLVVPITFGDSEPIVPMELGAGGEGPAGGGGGGTRGSGGDIERVQYVAVAPPPPAPAPVALPVLTPPPVVPEPKPEPEPVVPPVVTPPAPTAPVAELPVAATTPAPVPGVGGGTGSDGTAGSGPGSGGGVGSGVGTGRGSGTGPGTGGGTQENYPPTPTEMFLPPLPAPSNVKGFRLIAEFDVDSTGRVLDFRFTETKNGGYNRQIREVLRSIRFRPGTRPDGSPIRMKTQLEYTFY